MAIKNEAKIKNPLMVDIREQLEHRALRIVPGRKSAGKGFLKWTSSAAQMRRSSFCATT